MKEKKIIKIISSILGVFILISAVIFGYYKYQNTFYNPGLNFFAKQNALIVYYDRTNEIEKIAKSVCLNLKSCRIVKLEPVEQYPADEKEYEEIIKIQNRKIKSLQLKYTPKVDDFNIVFIGYPVELNSAHPIIKSFLKKNNFKDKIVAPILLYDDTYGASLAEIGRIIPDAHMKNAYIAKKGSVSDNVKIRVPKWLETIRITRSQIKNK